MLCAVFDDDAVRRLVRQLAACAVMIGASIIGSAQQKPQTLTTIEAKNHVGQQATVCGVVDSGRYVSSGRQPTFLNFDKPYPNQPFTALIWGSDRAKFGRPEETYKGQRICVTGKIETYRDVPEIILNDPGQISMQDEKKQ